MLSDRPRPIVFDATALSQLVCPACQGDLRLCEASVCCARCGRVYPVIDGIPVLIVERSEARGD